MTTLKCKMCGGDLLPDAGGRVFTCAYCGSAQTAAAGEDDRKLSLFNRANKLRLACEFDKAAALYEKLVTEFPDDAEGYWGLCLSKYGIEYVDDPGTGKKVPTCHRASFEAITADPDYKAALDHADPTARAVYMEQGYAIDTLQRGILDIVKNEKPFDVFLCYKETDENGRRTPDSVIANDIYYQLTNEGFKVFYAAITLENKLGQAYEPYIFAALHSAKVMLVIGTEPEYFNAVWVRNEWSRFLKLMKTDRTKLLIPCYKNMDPYDLPEEFSHLQAQDMGKIGFITDVIRGIKKVLQKDAPAPAAPAAVPAPAAPAGTANTAALLKRAALFLGDGDWKSADEYCERVLDQEPENAEAYVGKLLAELNVRSRDALREQPQPFDQSVNFQKALRFGDEALKTELTDAVRSINDRNEIARKDGIYDHALNVLNSAKTEQNFENAAKLFRQIPRYRDADKKAEEAETGRKEWIYQNAESLRESSSVKSIETAVKEFGRIPGFRDADERAKEAQEAFAAFLKEKERKTKRTKKTVLFGILAAVILVVGFIILNQTVLKPNKAYNAAVELMNKENYGEAIAAFEALNGYKDSADQISLCKYNAAVALMDEGKYDEAIAVFQTLNDYKDSTDQVSLCKYNTAVALMEKGQYDEAIAAFEALNGYKDSADQISLCKYNAAVELTHEGKYDEAIAAFQALNGYRDSVDQIEAIHQSRYDAAAALMKKGKYGEAIAAFEALNGYRDSVDQIEAIRQSRYDAAAALMKKGKYAAAGMYFGLCGNFKDAAELSHSCWESARKTGLWTSISTQNFCTVGLKTDGTVVTASAFSYFHDVSISSWKNIVAVTAGKFHTVGLKADSSVVAVGDNAYGQCNVSGWKDIVAVAAGNSHTVGLKADGTVVAVGDNDYGRCDVSGWTDIVAVAAGLIHTVGLKADGTVVAVGYNGSGQCDVSGWTDIVSVAAGRSHTVGLKADGTVVAVGDNDYGRCDVSGWTDIVAVAAGDSLTVGLKADGSVVAVGSNKYGQCDVSGWKNIVAVAAGDYHTVGLKADGTVVAVGKNEDGQCDVSAWKNIRVPEQ